MDERERLAAVHRYEILDMPPDEAFDRITAMAARLLNAPIGLVSIVDSDRIWFKSRRGLEVEQVGRDLGLCGSCGLQDNPWLVTNARTDVRAMANPLVAGEPGVQSYLGVPLKARDGANVGTLCVMDIVPRSRTVSEIDHLTDLAAILMGELELRLSARRYKTNFHDELVRRELREDHITALMRELAHRSKNLLAVVQAIARHMAQPGGDCERFRTP